MAVTVHGRQRRSKKLSLTLAGALVCESVLEDKQSMSVVAKFRSKVDVGEGEDGEDGGYDGELKRKGDKSQNERRGLFVLV